MTEQEPNLADKDEVLEASRKAYGSPRAEVERSIYKQMGWPTPEEERQKEIQLISHRLQGLGVSERQTLYLISSYKLIRIKRQLDWLPFRNARNLTADIIAAIRQNYRPPEEYRGETREPLSAADSVNPEQDPIESEPVRPEREPKPDSITEQQTNDQ